MTKKSDRMKNLVIEDFDDCDDDRIEDFSCTDEDEMDYNIKSMGINNSQIF